MEKERSELTRRLLLEEHSLAESDGKLILTLKDLPFHEALALLRTERGLPQLDADSPNEAKRKVYQSYESGAVIPASSTIRDLARDYLHVSGAVEQELLRKAVKARAIKRAASRSITRRRMRQF